MKEIIPKIRKEFKKNVDSKYKSNFKRFFKEDVKLWGVNSAERKRISKKYFAQVKHLEKEEIFALCEELLKTGYDEEVCLALNWAFKYHKYYQKSDFRTFERWLKCYVSNWASCDELSTHILGYFFLKFPTMLPKVKSWAQSKNRWQRRASAVALIYPLRNDMFLKAAFETAEILLKDKDDLVQKGYGWMLKEAYNVYPKEIFVYVMEHKDVMPRAALRYAIEKYPKELRQKAMKRD